MRELPDHTPSPTRPTSPRTVLLPALLTRLELAAYLGYSVMTIERLRIGDPTFPRRFDRPGASTGFRSGGGARKSTLGSTR